MIDGIDHTPISWRAWYTGNRVFESTTTSWEDLPEEGLLRVNVYYRTRPYHKKMQGRSLYWVEHMPEGVVYCYDDSADAIISKEAQENNRVKKGKWVPDVEFERVRHAADAARDAPNEEDRINRLA